MNEDIRITLKNKGFYLQPDGSYSKSPPVASELSSTQSEQPFRNEPLGTVSGKEKGGPRIVVRITAYRCRLQDADNNAGGCKYLIDGLRHAKIIADDSPDHIQLITEQVKVGSKVEEGTEITVMEEIE